MGEGNISEVSKHFELLGVAWHPAGRNHVLDVRSAGGGYQTIENISG